MSLECLAHSHALRTSALILAACFSLAPPAAAQDADSGQMVYKIQGTNERLSVLVGSSRIVSLDKKIPRVQVNNPELLDVQPQSATNIILRGKKPGVTQLTLWDEADGVHSIEVAVLGDIRELTRLLHDQFPTAAIRAYAMPDSSVILKGTVDRSDDISRILRVAESYYPKSVVNNISVGGVQQILLHVKLMEVSRTKLRDLGVDFANFSDGGNDFVTSSISGLLKSATAAGVTTTGAETATIGVVDASNSFFAVLNAMQRNQLMKVLAEPTLTTSSGRPAYFQVGGDLPILIPNGLGTVTIDYRKFGTQVDFVPIVLANGNIRLEVRPRVSEIDNTISVTLGGNTIPGFRTREVDTGVELKVGQTLALAGLVQTRLESEKTGVPWLADLPFVGVPFRRVKETYNEVELLVLVRPELAEAMDPEEVPPCGPGMYSASPTDGELYLHGYLEVPAHCPGGACANGPGLIEDVPSGQPLSINEARRVQTPRQAQAPRSAGPATTVAQAAPAPLPPVRPAPAAEPRVVNPPVVAATRPRPLPAVAPGPAQDSASAATPIAAAPSSRRQADSRNAVGRQNGSSPYNRATGQGPTSAAKSSADSQPPGLIGPVGYDVVN